MPEPFHPKPPTPIVLDPPKKALSELSRRLLTALVLIPSVLYIISVGDLLYVATVMLFTFLGVREFYRLIEDKGAHPIVGIGSAAAVALPVIAYLGNEYHATLLLTAVLLGLLIAQLRKAQISEALASISGTYFGVVYVGWLLSHAVVLRHFFSAASARYGPEEMLAFGLSPDSGIFFMTYTLVVVVLCDTGAYFAGAPGDDASSRRGSARARRSRAPSAASILGTVAGVIVKGIFDQFWGDMSAAFPWSACIPIGIVLSVAGILGDLTESLLKRDADVKDAGALLPGMGGILDRIDSPLLAIPIMYYTLLGFLFLSHQLA